MADKNLYISSLDGMRAVAVSFVFLAHSGLEHVVPGGFGVTIFFFLSGYLITTLLRLEFNKTNDISLRNFYLRRIYRIFPPLYLVLVIVIILSYSGLLPHDMKFNAVAAQFLHLTNYYSIFGDSGHFVPGSAVLWSLAIEEHFYLIFPLLFIFLMRKISNKGVAVVLVTFCSFVLLWRCYIVFGLGILDPYTYMATDARIDSIMFGCIMGVWSNPALDKNLVCSEHVKIGILVAALSVLLFCFLYRNPVFRETVRYSLQGLALFPIFYLAISRDHWIIFRWLNWKAVKALGIVSYTFYLFHLTGLNIAGSMHVKSPIAKGVVGFIITVSFSTIMYLLVEKRMAALRRRLHKESSR